MAHFAKINSDKEVLEVLVVSNEDCVNEQNVETESIGQQYLEQHCNWPQAMWIQTSYNTIRNTHRLGGTPFRGNYAGVGYTWDSENNIFWQPKPYASWVKHIESASWKSPIGDSPDLTQEQKDQNLAETHAWVYIWNEDNTTWDLTNTHS